MHRLSYVNFASVVGLLCVSTTVFAQRVTAGSAIGDDSSSSSSSRPAAESQAQRYQDVYNAAAARNAANAEAIRNAADSIAEILKSKSDDTDTSSDDSAVTPSADTDDDAPSDRVSVRQDEAPPPPSEVEYPVQQVQQPVAPPQPSVAQLIQSESLQESAEVVPALALASQNIAETEDVADAANGQVMKDDPLLGRYVANQSSIFLQASSESSPDENPSVLSGVVSEVRQAVSSAGASLRDGFSGLFPSSNTSALETEGQDLYSTANNIYAMRDLSTVPLPTATDTPDEAADKTFGQAIVGFGAFAKAGLNPISQAKALYGYLSKMTDQAGAQLDAAAQRMGLATDDQQQ